MKFRLTVDIENKSDFQTTFEHFKENPRYKTLKIETEEDFLKLIKMIYQRSLDLFTETIDDKVSIIDIERIKENN